LKANHNYTLIPFTAFFVVYQVKDTIFESKSQQRDTQNIILKVVYQVKDTIFESKSQLGHRMQAVEFRCLSGQRYNF